MIPWDSIKPTVAAWVAYGTGLDQVLWADDPRPFTERQWASIDLVRVEQIGNDYFRYDNTDRNNPKPCVMGVRKLFLLVGVESIDQSSNSAVEPIERFRTLSAIPLQDALLSMANLSWIDTTESTAADYELDERVISRMECTVTFECAVNFTVDDVAAQQSWIQTVVMTGEVRK